VPCATTAATRNAETLKYLIAGNRTAAQETIAIQFMPLGGSFANDGTYRCLIDSDSKERVILKGITGNVVRTAPNFSDFSTVVVDGTITPLLNTSHTTTSVFQTSSPNISSYLNGTIDNTSTVNTWNGTIGWGNYFWVGTLNTGVSPTSGINGLIQGIHIYNRPLTAGEVLVEKNLFSS
jgi:hypothetical protein